MTLLSSLSLGVPRCPRTRSWGKSSSWPGRPVGEGPSVVGEGPGPHLARAPPRPSPTPWNELSQRHRLSPLPPSPAVFN